MTQTNNQKKRALKAFLQNHSQRIQRMNESWKVSLIITDFHLFSNFASLVSITYYFQETKWWILNYSSELPGMKTHGNFEERRAEYIFQNLKGCNFVFFRFCFRWKYPNFFKSRRGRQRILRQEFPLAPFPNLSHFGRLLVFFFFICIMLCFTVYLKQ